MTRLNFTISSFAIGMGLNQRQPGQLSSPNRSMKVAVLIKAIGTMKQIKKKRSSASLSTAISLANKTIVYTYVRNVAVFGNITTYIVIRVTLIYV